MKRVHHLLPFLCMFLLFTGCYDVPYLVQDESQGVINDTVLGKWASVKQTPMARGLSLDIKRKAGTPWYLIKKKDLKTGEIRHLKAIVHKIGDHLIFSYQDDLDKDFSIFDIKLHMEKDPPEFEAVALNEGAPHFATKEEFLKFLQSKESNFWFKEGYTFRKTG